eukprot:1161356-Pelagomonas_calceolata.AAC.1
MCVVGYKGEDARRVWAAIYDQSALKEAAAAVAAARDDGNPAAVPREQEVLYRLISGMHTAITTSIVHNFHDEATGATLHHKHASTFLEQKEKETTQSESGRVHQGKGTNPERQVHTTQAKRKNKHRSLLQQVGPHHQLVCFDALIVTRGIDYCQQGLVQEACAR